MDWVTLMPPFIGIFGRPYTWLGVRWYVPAAANEDGIAD